ncbi:uncharacterized protein LOC110445620 [Mizuhopecten yessoensis]|uniref:VWFA domain-containing protein n=1 Tax=Mizuhopecten yessoensis TaxID=6573 RepID=A0A210QZ27_MIZYE|nr:uncharacterized protein LOC110445620 [Mizuhopecten yessoensis]OWF54033.1 hypothetical protein KP79_PYT15288 [Mizuhopecten yessoensis]
MAEDPINFPHGNEPKAEGHSPEETVHVMIGDTIMELTPDPYIKLGEIGMWYKELVITYSSEPSSSSKKFLKSNKRFTSDKSLIRIIWENMRRKYNAFLKHINTERKTLRFSVLTDVDFKRLKEKATFSMDELQTDMLKDTCLDGFVLKEIADAGSLPESACTDSGLETDSMKKSSCSAGVFNLYTDSTFMKGIKNDLSDIKQSILNLHTCSCINERRYRRTSRQKIFGERSHFLKYTRRQMSNEIRGHFSTSTDEDNLEMPNDSENFGLADQWFAPRPDQPGQPTSNSYIPVKNRNHCHTKYSFSRFQLQETPSCHIPPFEYETYKLGHRRKESTGSNDDDVEGKCLKRTLIKQMSTKTKRKQDQSKRKNKVQGHPDGSSRSHDSSSPVSRSGVKVLNPRPAKTEQEQRYTEKRIADRESPQNKPKEGTAMGLNHAISQNQLACQTPTVEPQQDLLLKTDKRQKADKDLAIKDQHGQVDAKDRTRYVDDELLLEKTISMMEQRGDVDLETDGITDPSLLSRIFNRKKQDVTNDTENPETVKTEQDDVVIAETAPHHGEQGTRIAVSPQELDRDGSEVSCSTSLTESRVTDTTGSADVCDLEVDTDGSVRTITPEDLEWSLESDNSYVPGLDAEKMLRRVGLDTNASLIELLNKNKKSIENSSQEAKGNGIDTVLLVDASSSMGEKSFEQMKSACHSIVEFVETVAAEKNIEENLALVVFGRNPMILQHLTMDYRKLYDKIENIEPGGSSPMCLGTLLSMMELHLRGGTTSIARYQIPPRVIILTDGRPTDDSRFQHQEIEFAVKSPTVKENVLLAMDDMRHHGYKVVCIPVGQAINRTFMADMVGHADGSIVEMDDLSSIKKHFLLHYTIAKVIGVSRDTGFENQYQEVIGRETAGLVPSSFDGVSFTEADVTMITTELEKSEELNDIEYPDLNLPPIGSRVSIPADFMSSHSGDSKEYGTVIQQKSTGTIKVEWDAGMFSFLDYSTEKMNLNLDIVQEPRRLSKGSLIEVGVEVIKVPTAAEIKSDTVRGRVFLTTNNGYVKVRWDDGTLGRYRYGADATFELHIVLESYAFNEYVWQYQGEAGKWITYPLDNQQKLESAFMKRSKTATTRTTRSSGRIIFADMTEIHTQGDDVGGKRPVRRITVAEMKTNFV